MMRKLFYLAIILIFIWLWREGRLPSFGDNTGAYDADGKPIVLAFTFPDCGLNCQTGLRELKNRRVPFKQLLVNPEQPESENFQMWKQFGRGNFPFIVSGSEKVAGTSKAQLATLLGENFGQKYLTGIERRYFKRHFDSNGEARIVLYGTDWCPYCAKLRKELAGEEVNYVDIDVEKSGEKETMLNTMEINGYPAVWVGYTRVHGHTLRDIRKVMRR